MSGVPCAPCMPPINTYPAPPQLPPGWRCLLTGAASKASACFLPCTARPPACHNDALQGIRALAGGCAGLCAEVSRAGVMPTRTLGCSWVRVAGEASRWVAGPGCSGIDIVSQSV